MSFRLQILPFPRRQAENAELTIIDITIIESLSRPLQQRLRKILTNFPETFTLLEKGAAI